MDKIRLRSTVKSDTAQDANKYTLNDLSRKELTMIFQSREWAKNSKQYANFFACCIIASFVLAILLSQRFHNLAVSLVCFVPIIAYFIFNGIRNRKIAKIVKQKIGQAIVDQSFNKPNEGGPVAPIRG